MSVRKRRFSVTLMDPYITTLDLLVKEGLYIDHQAVIRAALRLLFKDHGAPLTPEEAAGY